jgi:transcriptional regulator GlxA family with amidase domain
MPMLPSHDAEGHSRRALPMTMAVAVTRLLDDARGLLAHDQRAAILALARASNLLDAADEAPAPVLGGLARWQVKRLLRYIEAHIEGPILQKDLAAEARLSCGHFARSFKRSFGRTAHTYVMERRIKRAKTLMAETSTPLCEIALLCGLADQPHFSRVFRRFTGETPMAWRRRHQLLPNR